MDSMPEGCLYARISPALLAVYATERAAIEFEAAVRGETERWFFAITDIHQAVTAALVEVLSGSSSIGALTEKNRKRWLTFFEASRSDPHVQPPTNADQILHFKELVELAQSRQILESDEPDLIKLNDLRNDLAHVKQRAWYVEIAWIRRILHSATTALDRLFQTDTFGIHLEGDQMLRAKSAIHRLNAGTNTA